jgi:fermentation-respiration switch protein FrsA (DUF1100 family)
MMLAMSRRRFVSGEGARNRDEIVPLLHAEALFEAAPDPKRLHIIEGVGHNDFVTLAGEQWAAAITRFSAGLA